MTAVTCYVGYDSTAGTVECETAECREFKEYLLQNACDGLLKFNEL